MFVIAIETDLNVGCGDSNANSVVSQEELAKHHLLGLIITCKRSQTAKEILSFREKEARVGSKHMYAECDAAQLGPGPWQTDTWRLCKKERRPS